MNDCIFCKIARGDVPTPKLHEDEQVIVIRDKFPKAPVHLLVIPREHIENLAAFNERHAGLGWHMLRLLPEVARGQGLHDGFRTIINTGAGGGQEIPHLHFHILGGGRLPGF